MAELDAHRAEVLGHSARIIQRKVLTYQSRNKYLLLQSASTEIQSFCRGKTCCMWLHVGMNIGFKNSLRLNGFSHLISGHIARLEFEAMRREVASLRIQKQARTYICQTAYKKLCVSSISIQTGLRAMAARVELQYRKKRKAAIIIQASFKPHNDYYDLSFFVSFICQLP